MELPSIRISGRRSIRERRAARTRRSRSRSGERIVEVVQDSHRGGCIDLTSAVDEEFIDLTSPQAPNRGVNDASIVVVEEYEANGRPSRRNRHRNRQSRHNEGLSEDSSSDLEDPVIVLPDLNLSQDTMPSGTDAGSSLTVSSPGTTTITCPICLDDKRQIQLTGRQLCSTACGHVFCKPCIHAAIASASRCCPTCRKKLNKNKIFPLYI